MTTNDLLAIYRMNNSLTVDEVSERTGIPADKLMELESGKLPADDYITAKLAEVYGVDPSELKGDGADEIDDTPAEEARPVENRKSIFGGFFDTKGEGEETADGLPGVGLKMLRFPYFAVAIGVFLAFGIFLKAWHPAWVILLTIPVYYRLTYAFRETNPKRRLLKMPAVTGSFLLFALLGVTVGFGWSWLCLAIPPVYYAYVLLKKQ